MKTLPVAVLVDAGSGAPLVERTSLARTVWTRARGLLGRAPLGPGEGLWIEPCQGVHTCFMSFPIDVVFVDREGTILAVREALRSWRFTRIYGQSRAVLELAAGEARRIGLAPGLRVRLEPVGDRDLPTPLDSPDPPLR